MLIKDLKNCSRFTAGDGSILRELLNPLKEDLSVRYSLAHATVRSGQKTLAHRLKSDEVYYIVEGTGRMNIDDQSETVSAGQAVYIPGGTVQRIENTGQGDLVFLCIVDPAWKAEDEEVIETGDL